MSLIAGLLFAFDKRAASRGRRRIPERSLHLVELLGGWPGAVVASRVFRHKSSKTRYQVILLAIAMLHITAWIVFITQVSWSR